MSPNFILWIYVALLLAGGLMGFLKAGSKASLIASVAFAVPLGICAAGLLPGVVADALLAVLAIFFGVRFAKGRQFMPAGLMVILSVVTVALRAIL
jgi:uncharacterized membrane protein (UPF0136 family)